MLLRHSGEQGLCIDHFAALVVDGDTYNVLSIPNKPGSVAMRSHDTTDTTDTDTDTPAQTPAQTPVFSATRDGVPGIWCKNVLTDTATGCLTVSTTLIPSNGLICDLLKPSTELIQDPGIYKSRTANPLC